MVNASKDIALSALTQAIAAIHVKITQWFRRPQGIEKEMVGRAWPLHVDNLTQPRWLA